MAMDRQVLDRLSLFRLAPDHAETPSIAEWLRELVGGAAVAQRFLIAEAERMIAELRNGGGDRSLMTRDFKGIESPNESAVCKRVTTDHAEFGYSSETLRSWLQKGPPKTTRRSRPR
jgi:hypothetical protein